MSNPGQPTKSQEGEKPTSPASMPHHCPKCGKPYAIGLRVAKELKCRHCGLTIDLTDPGALERVLKELGGQKAAPVAPVAPIGDPKLEAAKMKAQRRRTITIACSSAAVVIALLIGAFAALRPKPQPTEQQVNDQMLRIMRREKLR